MLYYQDSASEDEQIEDELIPSHSELDYDYVFSDEEDEEENSNDDNDDDEDMLDDNETGLKKEVASFLFGCADSSRNIVKVRQWS